MTGRDAYARFRAEVEDDPNVVGLVLGGARGKGLAAEDADYDVYVVARDKQRATQRYGRRRGDVIDTAILSLDEFRAHAAIGSESEWNRYTFTHVRADVDKLNGEIQRLVDEKGVLPPDAAHAIADEALDAYVNAYYRSAKNVHAGDALAAHLDAAESVPYLLTAVFALNGRVRPYNKFLRWELERHPLADEAWSAARLLPALERVVAAGDLETQQALFRAVERLARERGHGAVIDGWEPDVAWLRGEDAA